MKEPFLSVVIPLYNKEHQIKNTINSILKQKFSDFEVIVINDGSTDASVQVVESFNDERIRIINQSNAGVSTARNRGMDESLGKYIVLLDADDCFLPDAFSLLEESPKVDIIIGSFIQTDEDGKLKGRMTNLYNGIVENVYKSYWKREFHTRMGNMFIRNELIKRKGGFLSDMKLYEDKEWILRVLDGAKLYISTKIILDYKRGTTGLSHGFKPIGYDFANMATVKQIKDNYKRKIIGDFVFRRFVNRLIQHDWYGVQRIYHNNSCNMLFCMISFIIGYIRDYNLKN